MPYCTSSMHIADLKDQHCMNSGNILQLNPNPSFDCGRMCRGEERLLRLIGEALRSSKVGPNNTDEETMYLTRKIGLFFVADMWLSLSRVTTIPFISSFFVHFFLDIIKDLQTCVSTEFEVAEWTITMIAGLLTRDTHEHHLHNYMITPHSEINTSI